MSKTIPIRPILIKRIYTLNLSVLSLGNGIPSPSTPLRALPPTVTPVSLSPSQRYKRTAPHRGPTTAVSPRQSYHGHGDPRA